MGGQAKNREQEERAENRKDTITEGEGTAGERTGEEKRRGEREPKRRAEQGDKRRGHQRRNNFWR